MELEKRIEEQFTESIEAQVLTSETLVSATLNASQLIVECLLNAGKVLCCGNGVGNIGAQHFTNLLMQGYERERPCLPTIMLSGDVSNMAAIAEANAYRDVFSQPIRALGQPGDLLAVFSDSATPTSIIQAVQAAHQREMRVVALTAGKGGDLESLLQFDDVEIRAPVSMNARIFEIHTLITHCLCDLIDHQLFGGN